jgi:hypothetical protein
MQLLPFQQSAKKNCSVFSGFSRASRIAPVATIIPFDVMPRNFRFSRASRIAPVATIIPFDVMPRNFRFSRASRIAPVATGLQKNGRAMKFSVREDAGDELGLECLECPSSLPQPRSLLYTRSSKGQVL